MTRKCNIAGCERVHEAKGLCSKHYQRHQSGGDPRTPSVKESPLENRFLANLGLPDPVTGCVEWNGSRTPKGYGQIKAGGISFATHRLAYERKHGPIPEGMQILHKCDNPPCCRDEHLFLGTCADNMADKAAKGRCAVGGQNGSAKLSDADVTEIRRRLATGETHRLIAVDFGVSREYVSRIRGGARAAGVTILDEAALRALL